MKRSFRIGIVPLSLLALAVALFLVLSPLAPIGPLASDEPSHEVWMLDQSGFPPSAVPSTDIGDIGGTLYIFNGNKLARPSPTPTRRSSISQENWPSE
jgi:hypothetical protein